MHDYYSGVARGRCTRYPCWQAHDMIVKCVHKALLMTGYLFSHESNCTKPKYVEMEICIFAFTFMIITRTCF